MFLFSVGVKPESGWVWFTNPYKKKQQKKKQQKTFW